MNYKVLTVVLVSAGVLGLVALTAPAAEAYRGDYSVKGPNYTVERETAMQAVMQSNDYEGWKKLMTANGNNPGVLRKIDTKEEFLKFAEAYRLAHAGKTAEAAAIRTSLGLGNGGGMHNGSGTCTNNQ